MNQNDQKESLINELISETAPQEFQSDLLRTTLDYSNRIQARRQKIRQASKLALVLITCAFLSLLFLPSSPNNSDSINTSSISKELDEKNYIQNTKIRVISDEELFTLFQQRPIAIVEGLNSHQLLFLDNPIETH